MIEFLGHTFFSTHSLLQDQYMVVKTIVYSGGGERELSANEKRYIRHLVQAMDVECRAIGLDATALQARIVDSYVSDPGPPVQHAQILAGLEALISHSSFELSKQRFVFVPVDRHSYFQGDLPTGLNYPASQFPSADPHTRDAGNSYTVGLYTATVYHLMCAAEIGLRAFAKHLKVTLHKTKGPIEWAQWEDILTAITNKVEDRAKGAKKTKPLKAADRAFYRGVLAEFYGFKDMYRNNVMHVRVSYSPHDAASALEKVGSFMQRLGERVHE